MNDDRWSLILEVIIIKLSISSWVKWAFLFVFLNLKIFTQSKILAPNNVIK